MTPKRQSKASNLLSHVSPDGSATMVDVSAKEATLRTAKARGTIRMTLSAFEAIRSHSIQKGDVISVAKLAGILAAKKTSELIPLCHPLSLEDVQIEVTPDTALPGFRVESSARTTGKTGVEMEAIVAVTIALVTMYDMAKSADRFMTISDISLVDKTGGKRV
jgi:cyclic pyranopterin monophosphate synthase